MEQVLGGENILYRSHNRFDMITVQCSTCLYIETIEKLIWCRIIHLLDCGSQRGHVMSSEYTGFIPTGSSEVWF